MAPLRVIFRDETKQLVCCYHDDRPIEGRCPDCGIAVFKGLLSGPTRFWEPAPGVAQRVGAERINMAERYDEPGLIERALLGALQWLLYQLSRLRG